MTPRIYVAILAAVLAAQTARAEPVPDGQVTHLGGFTAYLIAPTTRYDHGALGDGVEAGGFAVTAGGQTRTFMLPENGVFEDLRVRLQDLDGDGRPEAILIQSHLERGASIAVYDLGPGDITLRAQSSYIGRANRWLNIVGFADFTGRGQVEVAAVIMPHLTGSLRIFELRPAELAEVARIDGFTNHINGSRDLDLAVVADMDRDGVMDITLPRIDGSGQATVSFRDGRPRIVGP